MLSQEQQLRYKNSLELFSAKVTFARDQVEQVLEGVSDLDCETAILRYQLAREALRDWVREIVKGVCD